MLVLFYLELPPLQKKKTSIFLVYVLRNLFEQYSSKNLIFFFPLFFSAFLFFFLFYTDYRNSTIDIITCIIERVLVS